MGGFLSNIKETLIELITKNFKIKKKKRAGRNKRNLNSVKNKSGFSIASIIINSSIQEVKRSKVKVKKDNVNLKDDGEEIPDGENEVPVSGGYGTIRRGYGISPISKKTDYGKIWGYLGKFRTYNAYNKPESANEIAMQNGESSRQMVSTETIDKVARHLKYFVTGELMGNIGFVPPFGSNISSKEWEKYRLMDMMSIYKPLLKLKLTIA